MREDDPLSCYVSSPRREAIREEEGIWGRRGVGREAVYYLSPIFNLRVYDPRGHKYWPGDFVDFGAI